MKKRFLIILIIFFIAMVLSIYVYSTNSGEMKIYSSKIPILSEEEYKSIDEENKRFIVEKEEFTRKSLENPELYENNKTFNNEEKVAEMKKIYEDGKIEAKDTEEKITRILNKLYPKEFNEILKILTQETVDRQNNDVIKNAEYDLCNLILTVIELENVTDEELRVLKKFMKMEYINVYENVELKERIEKTVEIE